MIPVNHNGLFLPPTDPLNGSLMISETRWDTSVLDHTNTHRSTVQLETYVHGNTIEKAWIIRAVSAWTLIFCTCVIVCYCSSYITQILTYAWPSDDQLVPPRAAEIISIIGGQRSAMQVRCRIDFFGGPEGREVPRLQTSPVCPLIRSPGCHSIHHPTARHTAPLSRILQLQSGFHTHPLMTKPDAGTDSSS